MTDDHGELMRAEARKQRSTPSRVRSLVWYSAIAVLLVAFTVAKVGPAWTWVDDGIIAVGLFCCLKVIQTEVRALRGMFTNEQLTRHRERDRAMRLRSLPAGRGREVDLHDAIGTDIPIRSVAFYVAAVLVVWGIAAVVPWLGFTVPWGMAYVVIPVLVAGWLTQRTAPPQPPPGLDYGYIAQVEQEMDVEAGVADAGPEGDPR